MGKLIDLKGQRFGRLLVLRQEQTRKRRAYWLCRCDCGTEKILSASALRYGSTRSCGCLRKDISRARATKIDGHYYEKLHGVWNAMNQRCRNPNNADFKYYGARGVCICEEWQHYLPFREWALTHGYEEGLTIDRINTYGNYEPENCRWITIQEQQKNRRPRTLKPEGEKQR